MEYISLHGETNINAQYVTATTAQIDNLDIDNINTNNLVVNGTVSIPNLTPSRIIQTNGSSSLIASNTLNNTTLSGTTNLSSLVANQLLRLDALKNIINDNTNYIDEDELYSTLVDYVTTTIFLETLFDYVTFTQLSIALADYVTYIQLTNTLADYLTLTDFNNTLLSYYTANEVNILINDYFFLSGNNTSTGNNTFTGNTLISGTNSTDKFQIKRNDGSNFLRASTTSYTTYLGCSLIPDTNASFTIGEPSFRMSSIYSTNLYLSTVLNVSGITGSRVIQTDSSSNFIGSNTLNNITLSGTTTTGLTASRLIQTNGSSQLTASNALPVACTSTNMTLTTPFINTATLAGTTITSGNILMNNANDYNKFRIMDNSGNQIFNVNTTDGRFSIGRSNNYVVLGVQGANNSPLLWFANNVVGDKGMFIRKDDGTDDRYIDVSKIQVSTLSPQSSLITINNPIITSSKIDFTTTNTTDIGSSSKRVKDVYVQGTIRITDSSGTYTHTIIAEPSTNELVILTNPAGGVGNIIVKGGIHPQGNGQYSLGLSGRKWGEIHCNTIYGYINFRGPEFVMVPASGISSTWYSAATAPNIGTSACLNVNGTNAFYVNSSGHGQFTGNTVYKSAGSTFTNPSDSRLKQNIKDFNKGLDVIDNIQVREFEYKNQPDKKRVGVIAQEMLDVYPEAVTKDENGMHMFNASDMIFLLINSVKELKKENKILLNRIVEIENNMYDII